MRPLTADIAIIGAGPAGSTAAILLARLGYDVRLFDRETFPRDKICGDYLTAGALDIVTSDLGVLPELVSRGAIRLMRETVTTHSGRTIAGITQALACPRRITDACLVDAARRAGATVHDGVTVRRIRRDRDGTVTGFSATAKDGETLEVAARITVGADGSHSLLARELRAVIPIPRLHRIALRGYFGAPDEGGSDSPGVMMHLPRDRSMACCGFGAACGPDGEHNVNIVVPISESRAMAGRLSGYFSDRLQRSFPLVLQRLTGSSRRGPLRSTACFGHRTTRAAFPGAVLVGDAAMFIHPFTGEGVYFALRGAQLAASAIDAALRAGSVFPREYDGVRARELAPRYRLCDLTQRIVHSPALLSWVAERLHRSPALAERIFQVLGDRDAPGQLLTLDTLKFALAA